MGEEKAVSMADFLAQKTKAEKLDKEVRELRQDNTRLSQELKILKADEEKELSEAQKIIADEWADYKEKRAKLDEDLTSYSKREKEVRAKELVASLKAKGVEKVDEKTLLDAEDMDAKVRDLYVDFLEEQVNKKKEEEKAEPAESVFDRGAGAVSKINLSAIDVSTPEGRTKLAEVEKQLRAKVGVR